MSEEAKKSAGTVFIEWLLSIFFIIAAIGTFQVGALVGLTYLAIAALLNPITQKKLPKMSGKQRGWTAFGLFFASLYLTNAYIKKEDDALKERAQQTASVQQASSIPAPKEVKFSILEKKTFTSVGDRVINIRYQLNSQNNRQELENFLNTQADLLMREGYDKIALYAYPPGENEKSNTNWAAMLWWRREIGKSEVTFHDEMIAKLSDNPQSETTTEPAPTETAFTGSWVKINDETSKLDDSRNVTIGTLSTMTFRDQIGREVTPSLVIQCRENKTSVIIDWKTFVDTDDHSVTTRFDKEKATSGYWQVSTDYTATFAPSPVSFAKKMMDHDILIVQTIPHGQNAAMAEFYIVGLKEAVKPVREACKW